MDKLTAKTNTLFKNRQMAEAIHSITVKKTSFQATGLVIS